MRLINQYQINNQLTTSDNSQETQSQAIQNIFTVFTRQQCNKSLATIRSIQNHFQRLTENKKKGLGTNDNRSLFEKCFKTSTNHDRSHIIGLKLSKELFIWAVKNSHWRPIKKACKKLLRHVVNFEGNFMIDSRQNNIEWWNMSEYVLSKMLNGQNPKNLQQVQGLLRLFNQICHSRAACSLTIFQSWQVQQASLFIKSIIAQMINSILTPVIAAYYIKTDTGVYQTGGLVDNIFMMGVFYSFLPPIKQIIAPYNLWTNFKKCLKSRIRASYK